MPESRYKPVEAIEYLRRSHPSDGVIVFSKPNKKGAPVAIGGCGADELEGHTQLIERLCRGELYATSNSVWRSEKVLKNGLRYARRQKIDIRFIERVSVDLDVGRQAPFDDEGTPFRQLMDGGHTRPPERMTAEEAVQIALKRLEKSGKPAPSAIVHSGQGAQLHWDLANDQGPTTTPRDTSTNKRLHEAVGKALIDEFSDLAPDKRAWNSDRIFRVPNSINGKSKSEVWALCHEESPRYTLAELARAFGAKQSSESKKVYGKPRKNPTRRVPNNKRGKIDRATLRYEDIQKVKAERGGWKEGARRNSLWVEAQMMETIGIDAGTMATRLRESAALCSPTFPTGGNDGIIDQIVDDVVGKNWLPGNPELMRILDITPELSARLELQTIMTEEMLEARNASRRAKKIAGKTTTKRRGAIARQLETQPSTSINQMAELMASQSFTGSRSTIAAEMKVIRAQKPVIEAKMDVPTQSAGSLRIAEFLRGFKTLISAAHQRTLPQCPVTVNGEEIKSASAHILEIESSWLTIAATCDAQEQNLSDDQNHAIQSAAEILDNIAAQWDGEEWLSLETVSQELTETWTAHKQLLNLVSITPPNQCGLGALISVQNLDTQFCDYRSAIDDGIWTPENLDYVPFSFSVQNLDTHESAFRSVF